MRRPPRPERRRQVDDDAAADRAGDPRRGRARAARVLAPGGVEAGAGAARRHAAARQPRRHAHRRAEPARLLAPLPDPAGGAERRDPAGARDGQARRPAWGACRRALRRDAAAAPDRPRARAPPAARAPRRADRRPRPAGAAGALGADRRAAQRGDDDPDVDALHRGGAAPGRHGDDHVPRQGGRGRSRRRSSSASTPAPRCSRSTARRRGWRRSKGWPARRVCGRGARARASRSSGSRTATGSGSTASGGAANLEDVFVLLTGEEIG